MPRKFSGPMASMVDSPTAEHMEWRSPTQSQNSNILPVSMPNFATSDGFAETATKCLPSDFSSAPSPANSQARADNAFAIVSRVVNESEQIINRVSEGSKLRTLSTNSDPSILP